jgi:hypothetical protein
LGFFLILEKYDSKWNQGTSHNSVKNHVEFLIKSIPGWVCFTHLDD